MVNKKYKDRLFCLLFGNEEHKDNILSLYNALCHTTYTNEEDIQIYTIDDVIYIKMKNDVSILLDSFLYLWEQQSTFNPNMPIRGFMYFGKCMIDILPRIALIFMERMKTCLIIVVH